MARTPTIRTRTICGAGNVRPGGLSTGKPSSNSSDGNFRPNKLIDGKLSSVVMLLPGSRGPAPGLPADGVQSLASRNLMRHVNFGIPSGQAIARRMGLPVLTPTQLEALTPFGMEKSTPLWFYILKEAELMENGLRLGPVGSRIVGEVFIGLLKADETFLSGHSAELDTGAAVCDTRRVSYHRSVDICRSGSAAELATKAQEGQEASLP